MPMQRRDTLHILLDSAVTKGVNYAPASRDLNLDRYSELVVTLAITAAERDSGNETYDFYLITGDGLSEWDLAHFPQIASTGAKTFTARLRADLTPETVTTAAPGVVAVDSATLLTTSTNAPKTLAAGTVRHGPWGNKLRYELVVAGTIATGISYSVQVQARQ
jgi:hypothetical protein